MSDIQAFRDEIDDFMRHHMYSPLTPEQRRAFAGLNYYDYNEALVLELEVDLFPAGEPVEMMQTSTGDVRPYRRWGKVSFAVDGEEASLVIYSDPDGKDLFLPFRDATSGPETYGAGRYMDNHRPALTLLNSTLVEVDFNLAYNPYCAYNESYSCPLPPRDNWLKVPIRAGEKNFK